MTELINIKPALHCLTGKKLIQVLYNVLPYFTVGVLKPVFFLVEPKFEGGLGTIKTVDFYLFSSSTGNTYKNEMRLKTNYSNATRTPGDESGRKRAGC